MAATTFNFKQILKAINFEIVGNNGLNLVVRSKAFLKKIDQGLRALLKIILTSEVSRIGMYNVKSLWTLIDRLVQIIFRSQMK